MLRQTILENFSFDPTIAHTRDAVQQLCLENHYDPIHDYLDGLQWDRIPRIDRFFIDYFGADDTLLNRAIGRMMLVAAVRRARYPGCKFDQIVVLEGEQGTGKSTALKILAGTDYFNDQGLLNLDEREQVQAMQGFWIHELAELEGMNKAEINRLKAFASRTEDRARPAFGHFLEHHPRRCIFVGTTNENQYLRDSTGNRRFWPVHTRNIDLDGLRRDRDQLWAEAAHAEANQESIILPADLWIDAAAIQAERLEYDPWLDALANVTGDVLNSQKRVATTYLLTQILNIPSDRQNAVTWKRLKHVMRLLGWKGPKVMRFNDNKNANGYYKELPDKTSTEVCNGKIIDEVMEGTIKKDI